MRSRYTAYVLGDGAHLFRSWHPRTRPGDTAPDPRVRWLGLEVLDVVERVASSRPLLIAAAAASAGFVLGLLVARR